MLVDINPGAEGILNPMVAVNEKAVEKEFQSLPRQGRCRSSRRS